MSRVLDTVRRVWARVRAEEPARLAEGVRLLLVALVGAGWVVVPDARINAVASLVAVVASVFATKQVRGAVRPLAKIAAEWEHLCSSNQLVVLDGGERCTVCGLSDENGEV